DAWQARPEEERKPHNVARWLQQTGQWEGAWALSQLHYDQYLKQEVKTKDRLHKGDPLCNLAILARSIDSPTLIRHYALLSSAGDIYWKHVDPNLQHGGLAPTMLEQFESRRKQQEWREKVGAYLQLYATDTPLYLEAFLAASWFSDTYSQHFRNLAEVEKHGEGPFVEVLLDKVEHRPTHL